jgi:hypothetical protein
MEDLLLSGVFGNRASGHGPGGGTWLILGAVVLVFALFLMPPSGSAAGRSGFRLGWMLAAGAGVILLYLVYLQFRA